jgi:hypothetical protein
MNALQEYLGHKSINPRMDLRSMKPRDSRHSLEGRNASFHKPFRFINNIFTSEHAAPFCDIGAVEKTTDSLNESIPFPV